MLDVEFADRLKAHRLKHFMTQEQAARSAGVPYQSFVVAEGGRIGLKNREKLSKWLDRRPRKKGGRDASK